MTGDELTRDEREALGLLAQAQEHIAGAIRNVREHLPPAAALARLGLAWMHIRTAFQLLEPPPTKLPYIDGRMFFQGRPPCGWRPSWERET